MHEQRVWLAWHTAYLPHMKKPPRYQDLLGRPRQPKVSSWQTQLAAAMALTKRVNGGG